MTIDATIINLRQSLSKALKDIKTIESYISELRHSLNIALIQKKEIEKKYNYTLYEIKRWTRRAELAFINEKEDLVRVAILRKKHFIYQEQKIKKQIEDSNSNVELLNKKISVWESEIEKNIIIKDESKTLKDCLSQLEIQFSYLQKEIEDIAARLCKFNPSSLYSDDYQFYNTEKMSVFEKLELKLKELEREQEFIVELEDMSIEEQVNTLESSNIDYELQQLRAQLDN